MQNELARHIGTLQNWNDERGFGFIRPNTEGMDVFIHIKDFKNRASRPKIGDVLVYRLTQDRNGKPRAIDAHIQWDANSINLPKSTAWLVGELRSWDDGKGYGFIVPADGGQDIFVHINKFKHDTYRPVAGGKIYYRLTKDANGKPSAYDAIIKEDAFKHIKKKITVAVWVIALSPFLLSAYAIFAFIEPAPAMIYLVMSVLAFFMYAKDKHNAKNSRWRTRETELHIVEFFGGWPGALLAQRELRHKSRKKYYQFIFWLIVAIHMGGWAFLVLSRQTGLV